MKVYQRVLSILGGVSLATLMLAGITTALLTDDDQEEVLIDVPGETVEIDLRVDGLPENSLTAISQERFDIKPVIENKGTASIYIFQEMDVPMVGDVPLFTYEADTGYWELVSVTTEDGYQKAIYS